ncbi:hypothetical protein Hanom_Chr10g00903871 [Helianthus anomalus]
MEMLYRILKAVFSKIDMEPMFSIAEVFNNKKFKEDEAKRKAEEAEIKKTRLKSAVNVTEGDESDEEEADRDEMPSKFVEWGLEDDVLCELEDGEEFSPQHPEWFKKEREKLLDFYQVVTIEKTEVTDKIICWMYINLKGMFIVKRSGGVIQYFKNGFDMQTLPRWDIRELGRSNYWERKVTWVIDLAKVVTRIKLPPEVPVSLNNFKKWFYDSQTGEAVISSNSNEDIKILHPMDVFMFGLSDLNVLYANKIHVGAGNVNLEEAMLF